MRYALFRNKPAPWWPGDEPAAMPGAFAGERGKYMRHRVHLGAAMAAMAAMSAVATAQPAAPAKPGYLAPGAFDVLTVLSPAPVKGEARYKADRAIFKRTRAWIGTPRYDLATRDVDFTGPALMRDFSCAAGVALTPEAAPRTLAMMTRVQIDTGAVSRASKDHFRRLRPFQIDRGQIDRGKVCQPPEQLTGSFDYPSGHTILGWTWASLLAEAMPDRATPIMARGRAYGESRIVCGVHNASAVDGGRAAASALLAPVHAAADFRADMAAATAELAALRRAAPPMPIGACDVEAKLVALSVFTPPGR